jgi:hypothetical protein
VPELSPESSAVELTDLRIGKLCYLLAPVGLRFLQRAQRYPRECAEQRQRQQQQRLLGSVPIPLPLIQQFKPSRRETRLLILDILWKPHQQLTVTLRNSDTSAATKVSIELVLYAHDKPLPVAN